MQPGKSRHHEDQFRCPQCDRIVTVRAGFRRDEKAGDALVRFECTMEGMCGSPIWDPCPMYMAYMERTPAESPQTKAEENRVTRKAARNALKDAW